MDEVVRLVVFDPRRLRATLCTPEQKFTDRGASSVTSDGNRPECTDLPKQLAEKMLISTDVGLSVSVHIELHIICMSKNVSLNLRYTLVSAHWIPRYGYVEGANPRCAHQLTRNQPVTESRLASFLTVDVCAREPWSRSTTIDASEGIQDKEPSTGSRVYGQRPCESSRRRVGERRARRAKSELPGRVGC